MQRSTKLLVLAYTDAAADATAVAASYSVAQGAFRPPPAQPAGRRKAGRRAAAPRMTPAFSAATGVWRGCRTGYQ